MDWDQSKVNVMYEGENYYLAGSQMGLLRANRICLLDFGLSMVNNPKALVRTAEKGSHKQKARAEHMISFLWDVYRELMENDVVDQPVTNAHGNQVVATKEQSRFANPTFEKSMVEGANDSLPNHTFNLWKENFKTILPHLVWQRHVPNDKGQPEQSVLDRQLEPTFNIKRQSGLKAIRTAYEAMKDGPAKEYIAAQVPEWIRKFDAEETDDLGMEELKNA